MERLCHLGIMDEWLGRDRETQGRFQVFLFKKGRTFSPSPICNYSLNGLDSTKNPSTYFHLLSSSLII